MNTITARARFLWREKRVDVILVGAAIALALCIASVVLASRSAALAHASELVGGAITWVLLVGFALGIMAAIAATTPWGKVGKAGGMTAAWAIVLLLLSPLWLLLLWAVWSLGSIPTDTLLLFGILLVLIAGLRRR